MNTSYNDLNKPLTGIRVVDFSQFLAGPACSLRLADLGAEVIKVERPIIGDICRKLYVAKQKVGDESTIFHAINRNKKSVSLNLKDQQDLEKAFELIKTADVVIQNFRPGVAKRLGIDYDNLKQINNKLVYGSVSGYGKMDGPWHGKPGQDLLAQSLSGLAWENSPTTPAPMGLAIGDLMAAYELTQGILSLLVRRGISGKGGLAEVSLIESLIGIQTASIIGELNPQLLQATEYENVSGIYETQDDFIAIGNTSLPKLIKALALSNDIVLDDLHNLFKQQGAQHWITHLSAGHIDAEILLDWHQLRASSHYQNLAFEQTVYNQQKLPLNTTRCPIKIDGNAYYSELGAPAIGEHNALFWKE